MKAKQGKFYKFKNKYEEVLVNNKYRITTIELKQIIDNIVVELKEVNKNCWRITLEENIIDNSNILYIEAL